MHTSNYDVVVVGAGAAGLTAAIGLERAGFRVVVVEAAAFPGAENWSGCVYFCENLANPAILGQEGVEALAWERRLVERGFFATDGQGLLGMTYREPGAFRNCYTVLRPIYDHHIAQIARRHGVAILAETTAESLIREGNRVIGICTQRGPIYADLTFLAEGDASHLVTREGYERLSDERDKPKFLQGIKQVIQMPEGAIERAFGVGPEEGVAYECLLRNGTLHGRKAHLNMGGFIYTNRRSISVGLVLPADNLNENFGGDPNLLIEWFESLPVIQPWLEGGRRGVFGAKIIRGGGARDIPNLIDDGLAIGGAASAIGVDFPYPNFTGPATAMGLLITQAAIQSRNSGGNFSREELQKNYLEPLQRTHYWQDVEFLRRWPGYVKRTRAFFDRDLDLVLGTAYIWTRPKSWFLAKWTNWVRLLLSVAGPTHWPMLRNDLRHLVRALRLRDVTDRPALGRLLLDGTINALRDLFGRPRPNLPQAGELSLLYRVAGGAEVTGSAPRFIRRWSQRFTPILAAAARRLYTNDRTPLLDKLPDAIRLLIRQVNVLDLIVAGSICLGAAVWAPLLTGWDRIRGWFSRRKASRLRGLYARYAQGVSKATDLTSHLGPASRQWESRLAQLSYESVKSSHIHLLWPQVIAQNQAIKDDGLWHVCPAHVYEARINSAGQLQVIVNFENCIKCETCWRVSGVVDWGRDGRHRFTYPVHSPVVTRLLEATQAAALTRPSQPKAISFWQPAVASLNTTFHPDKSGTRNGQDSTFLREIRRLLQKLDYKIQEFDEALAEEPRTIDPARAEYLEMLARYVQQLAQRMVELLREQVDEFASPQNTVPAYQKMLDLAAILLAKAQERARRTWNKQYAWAAADGRQMRWHHLAGLRQFLDALDQNSIQPTSGGDILAAWMSAERNADALVDVMADCRSRLDAAFPTAIWRDLEKHKPLSSDQEATLRDLVAKIPPVNANDLAATLHPPLRKDILAELAIRDPSLAYRAVSHLWARDIAHLAAGSSTWSNEVQKLMRGDHWACFGILDSVQITSSGISGEALFIPAMPAKILILLVRDRLLMINKEELQTAQGVYIEAISTLGLRGAGLARIRLENSILPENQAAVDPDRMRRVWNILSAFDLISIARGMADVLCKRAISHATSRVQFPGFFQDEEARDTIGKFGAVKKMVSEMCARRYVIETLEHTLSPADFSSSALEHAELSKAVAAEALGTAPGSIAYNAGQIFGGTGYSEDDILAKYYRDAAAWRFLGPVNSEVFRGHGLNIFHHWRADGNRLAALPQETDLFEELVQRKALQAELDEIRNSRSRLRAIVGECRAIAKASTLSEPGAGTEGRNEWVVNDNPVKNSAAKASIVEALGRQDALLLCSKAVVLRTHARLENGLRAETQIALARIWLEQNATSLDTFERDVRRCLEPGHHRDDRPVVEPNIGPPIANYADFLAAPGEYDSGDFLNTAVDLVQPQFVPEMIESDPVLASYNRRLRSLFSEYFGKPRLQGLPYERYIEKNHRPDEADLNFCRQNGFFRMPIAKAFGGEARSKIDYYILISNAQRLADVAVALTIQANTSIGTSPVLIAYEKDLPRAINDLNRFLAEPAFWQEMENGLRRLAQIGSRKKFKKKFDQTFATLNTSLDNSTRQSASLKILILPFLAIWQQLQGHGEIVDDASNLGLIHQAEAAWKAIPQRAEEWHSEFKRRQRACELFLRWVASGQISAFALTEPSAGSDTARVGTRAQLRSVPVEALGKGLFRFIPVEAAEPRYLLDAARIEFISGAAHYRFSDNAKSVPIHFEEYDYDTDDFDKQRFCQVEGQRFYFTDIAQVRQRDDRLWYDYWELSGAKMWITNARVAGVMCLYAKTENGVTGFIVDRHAEGLVIGKDEAKMGQCGSPTNEISLQAVRVPRENVIGIEGRGQVNALETLNVGRAGLAVSAVAQMEGLIQDSRLIAGGIHGEIPDWVGWRLQEMEEARFIAESLAYEVIGRFEHPQTKSVRMESAISKMLASELLHHIIELAEDIHGLAGQTQMHRIEKRKRDARILNIYEGTNEIQRFFILKDLAAEVAPRWQGQSTGKPCHVSREALELETLKGGTRNRIEAALANFGQELWQNPNLQANCFLLAEATAWLKAAESTLGRLAWLTRFLQVDETAEQAPQIVLARRALARCHDTVNHKLEQFDNELAHLRRSYYAPAVRAANLLFNESKQTEPPIACYSQITRQLSILVIVEPSIGNVPYPHVDNGRLQEPHLVLSGGDRAALEVALQIRDSAPKLVTVQVAAVGSQRAVPVLQETLNSGADKAFLLVSKADVSAPDTAAAALASEVGPGNTFDLVLGGTTSGIEQHGLLARLAAEALGLPFKGFAETLTVQNTAADQAVWLIEADASQKLRKLPAAVLIKSGIGLRSFSIADYFTGLAKNLDIVRWPKKISTHAVKVVEGGQSEDKTYAEPFPTQVSPEIAVEYLRQKLLLSTPPISSGIFLETPEKVSHPSLLQPNSTNKRVVLAVLATSSGGRLERTARVCLETTLGIARFLDAEPKALVLVPEDQSVHAAVLAQILEIYRADVLLLAGSALENSAELKSFLLTECWTTFTPSPQVIVGEPWTENAFATLARRPGPSTSLNLRVRRLILEKGKIVTETIRSDNRLRIHQELQISNSSAIWVGLADGAETALPIESLSHNYKPRIQLWAPRLERFYGQADIQRLLGELKHETGLLRLENADFIIDIGFGVGNRDGYDLVVEPLIQTLQSLGVQNVVVGGSRKVTEELHLLPPDRQIGQSGVKVNPQILIAIGVSGAPQHLNYIADGALIVAFNRDPEAPIMTLNKRQSRPRVFPVVGDLFVTLPEFTRALQNKNPSKTAPNLSLLTPHPSN